MPRTEYAASYRVLIKETIVKALRRVFDQYYADPAFQNLKISTAYPLEAQNYPAIVVKWHGGSIQNAGIGNVETMPDQYGNVRAFLHSRFEGSIEFDIYSLSPDQVDEILDALIEVLRFGVLEEQTNTFFDELYNQATIDGAQINLNTDYIRELSDSATTVPWGAEDGNQLSYSGGLEVEVQGSYYSADRSGILVPILEVDVYPYIDGSTKPDGRFVADNPWPDAKHYVDGGWVVGKADVGGVEQFIRT